LEGVCAIKDSRKLAEYLTFWGPLASLDSNESSLAKARATGKTRVGGDIPWPFKEL
jgi:hypothetical protein